MEKESAIPEFCPVEKVELRRDVTVWGSYMWGYADVGADIYAALGLVMGAAHGGASLAFFVAGLIHIMIGLAYTCKDYFRGIKSCIYGCIDFIPAYTVSPESIR